MAGFSMLGRRGAISTLALAALVLSLAGGDRAALAVVPSPVGFQLDMSPSPRILDALDMNRDSEITMSQYKDIIYDESCDNPHLRIRARNRPAIMITNWDGTTIGPNASVAPITSFTLAINNPGAFIFGSGDTGDAFTGFIKDTIYTDAGVDITGSSLSADKKTLTVNFSGLDAGKKAIFCIDLDTTDPNAFMYPDYRLILFGTPDNPTTPGTATSTFVNAASPLPNSTSVALQLDPLTMEPEFEGANIRPYQEEDKMEVLGGGVPEPSAVALALAGLAAIALRTRSRSIVA
jgi:hypothetical protein